MIRLLLFLALSYCFNGLVLQESKIDFTLDVDSTSQYYWDFFYVVLPLTALLYARIAKWIFTFNKKVKELKKAFAQPQEPVLR